MSKRIIFNNGDKIGECTYLREQEPQLMKNSKEPKRMALFLCKCGKEFVSQIQRVKNGQFCGCVKTNRQRALFTRHGESDTKLYKLWKGIKKRCYCETEPSYIYYGKLGIGIQESWKNDFVRFKEYVIGLDNYDESKLGIRKDQLTLDRINSYESYIEGNLRWATPLMHSKNKRK